MELLNINLLFNFLSQRVKKKHCKTCVLSTYPCEFHVVVVVVVDFFKIYENIWIGCDFS